MYKYYGTVKNVLDANTLEILVDLGFGVTIRRVFGVIGMKEPVFAEDIEGAQESKNIALSIVTNRKVIMETQKIGRFGRYVADIKVLPENTDYVKLFKDASGNNR